MPPAKTPVKIKTTGVSSIARPAERAVLTFSVEETHADKAIASSKVLSCTNSIRDILISLGPKLANGQTNPNPGITFWSMGTLSTRSYIDYREYDRDGHRTRRERVFDVSTEFEVKFKDFSKLSTVAADLSSMPLVNIHGVQWRLTDATKEGLVSESRNMAAKDALERAKNYAWAFSLYDVTPVEIEEDAVHPHFGVQPISAARQMRARDNGGGDSLSFHPQDVSLEASVTIHFHAE